MKIGFFADSEESFIGAVFGERVFNLTRASGENAPVRDLTSILLQGRFGVASFQTLHEAGKERLELWRPLETVQFLPLFKPRKIVCLGLNYPLHAREGNVDVPAEPIYFEKATTAIIAHGEPVIYPDDLGRIDPEVELAVVMGRQARHVREAEAGAYIAGYTVLNDVTARDLQAKDLANRHPWYRSKSIDTFCPFGPWLVTADEIDPKEPLSIRLRVNGEVRQDSSTRHLVFDIPTLIERISALITLEAGDIISTGTPEGIAPIYPGDVMEAEVEKVGVLRNPVARQGA